MTKCRICNNTLSKGNKSGLCRIHCHNKKEAIPKIVNESVHYNNSEINNSMRQNDEPKTKVCILMEI